MKSALLSVFVAACMALLSGCGRKEEAKAPPKPRNPAISQKQLDEEKARQRAEERKAEAEAMNGINQTSQQAAAEQAKQDKAAVKEMKAMVKEAETTAKETEKAIKDAKTPPKKKGKAGK
ncbi:MAG: hypothetical protein GXP25_17390 [Planctomycetes bacterium]|nr:hypothetical protein [Planctomycetota bacterium]